jgi:hypothetical protein
LNERPMARLQSGGECRSRTCPTFRSRRVSTAMPCRSANSPEPWQDSVVRPLTSDSLIADVMVALVAVEAAGAQAALFETGVPSHTDTSRCARASRSTPCRHARRGRRAAPASRRDNPRLRLHEGSKGRQSVEVVASHDGLLWFRSDKMVRAVGFEPTTSWFQARSAAGLRYALNLDHPAGLEPATSRSATGCSRPLSYGWIGNRASGIRDEEILIPDPCFLIPEIGSGRRNRTCLFSA